MPPSGERLDDALELWHSDSWDCSGGKPPVSAEQLAHGLMVLERWFREEFTPKRQRVPAAHKPKTDKGSQHEGRTRVYARSGRVCEIQVEEVCTGRAAQWHHRKDRQQGGTWRASNGLDACAPCHRFVTEDRSEKTKGPGWVVEPWRDPLEVPVLRRGEWVLLDDEGGFTPALNVDSPSVGEGGTAA